MDWHILSAAWGELDLNLSYSFIDDHYVHPHTNGQPLPDSAQIDAYGLVDARLTLSRIPVQRNTELAISLWGKNMTDEEYVQTNIDFGDFVTGSYGDRATYGIEARLGF